MTVEVIAGPDGVRDLSQMKAIASWAQNEGVTTIRGGLYKPRSAPRKNGDPVWVGLGGAIGMPIVCESLAGTGLRFLTEFFEDSAVDEVAEILKHQPDLPLDTQIGARTGPGNFIAKITSRAAKHFPQGKIVVKNQMEPGLDTWVNRLGWAKEGAPEQKILAASRGHSPGTEISRNQPNWQEALDLKKALDIPVIVDPSHTAGFSPENVVIFTHLAVNFHNRVFDSTGIRLISALMLEIDPNPEKAECDRDQLLNLCQATALINWVQQNIRN